MISFIFLIYAFIFKAICDTIKFHWSSSVFFHLADSKFKNWLNPDNYVWMYKNGDITKGERFWGSSRWFAFLIDGWHFFMFLMINCFLYAVVFMHLNSTLFEKIYIEFALYVLYGFVFEFMYGKWLKYK